jgi:WD40 repeat protein
MGAVSGAISGLGLLVLSRGRFTSLAPARLHLFSLFLPAAGGIGLLAALTSLALTQLTPCAGLDRALGRSGCIHEVGLELPYENVMSFTPDGEVLAAGARDNGVVEVWRLSDASLALEISSPETGFTTAALSPDGSTVATVAMDGRVPLYRISDGMLIRVLELCSAGRREGDVNYPDYLEFSPDGRMMAAPDAMDSEHLGMTIWSTSGFDRTCLFPPQLGSDAPSAMSVAEDGRLAVGTKSGAILMVQPERGEITHLATTQEYVQAISFAPGGEAVAAYLGDGSIRSWSALDGRALWATRPAATPVGGCLVYSPNGKMLAAAVPGVRAHIRVIRAEDGKVLQTFSGACGLAFSSDSEVLVSQGWQTVRHWRIDPNPGRSTD